MIPSAILAPDTYDKPLTFAEAQELTTQIRDHAENLWSLLKRAHDGKAWAVIGHKSWEEYVKLEFSMSRRRSYQLLDYANIREALSDVNNCTQPKTEGQARPLVELETEEEQQEAWTEAVEASGGKPTAKDVQTAVQKVKGKSKPTKRGAFEDWQKFRSAGDDIAEAIKTMETLTVDADHRTHARDLAAKLSKQLTKLSNAQ